MKITAKFIGQDGNTLTATFDQATQTVTDQNGRTGKYSRADDKTMHIDIAGGAPLTITIAEPLQYQVGFTTAFTASDGRAGTVTLEQIG